MSLTTKDVLPSFTSSSSIQEVNDGGGLTVAGSETAPANAAILNNLPLVPTFPICNGSEKLTRYCLSGKCAFHATDLC